VIERAAEFFDERMRDTLRIAIPNGAALAIVNISVLKEWASLGLILLTAAYTIWRWRAEIRRGDK
jgi:hypothetical protein